MTDIMGRAWLLRGLLLALLVTAGPAELEERNGSEENAFGMFGKFFVPAKMERPSATTKPAATSPVTAWPSPPISATKAPSPTAATTTPGPTTSVGSSTATTSVPSSTATTSEAVTENPLLRMMLEAKLKVLKRREMVAEIGQMAAEEEERRSQKKLSAALKRKMELLMEDAAEDDESGPRMEERSIDFDDGGGAGILDGSPLQSAMTEFFRTSTPEPLDGATTTPAPFTLADNTLLGGLNTTAPLRFGNRKLIAVTELANCCCPNQLRESDGKCINHRGFDEFSPRTL